MGERLKRILFHIRGLFLSILLWIRQQIKEACKAYFLFYLIFIIINEYIWFYVLKILLLIFNCQWFY